MHAPDLPLGSFEQNDFSSDEADDGEAAASSLELADYLYSLRVNGSLSARDVCVIAWFGQKAGLKGAATDFAFRPDAPSGHYQRHLDAIVGHGATVEGACQIEVPIC